MTEYIDMDTQEGVPVHGNVQQVPAVLIFILVLVIVLLEAVVLT